MGILILDNHTVERNNKTKQQQVLENWKMNVNVVIIALCCLFVMNLEISYARRSWSVISRDEIPGGNENCCEKMMIELKEFKDSTIQEIKGLKSLLRGIEEDSLDYGEEDVGEDGWI